MQRGFVCCNGVLGVRRAADAKSLPDEHREQEKRDA
jgi:hypothetical protein